MKTVLFTPAGSGMAVTGIKSLSGHADIRTVATDIDELAPGLHLADEGYLVPEFDDDDYLEAIGDIVAKEDVDIVVPSLDPILPRFAEARDRVADRGASVMVSPPETVSVTQDKWSTYTELSGSLPFPDSTTDISETVLDETYFIKPRRGSGSENAHAVHSRAELRFHYERIDDPIIQTYLPGTEYTIDCLTDENGLVVNVQRKRLEITGGISTKVEVVDNDQLNDIARGVAERLDFVGPFFIQAREDATGEPHITEIGARIAGTMCGGLVSPDLHYLAVKQLLGESIPQPSVAYGTRMTRYWCEQYVAGDTGFEQW